MGNQVRRIEASRPPLDNVMDATDGGRRPMVSMPGEGFRNELDRQTVHRPDGYYTGKKIPGPTTSSPSLRDVLQHQAEIMDWMRDNPSAAKHMNFGSVRTLRKNTDGTYERQSQKQITYAH
jgi:hypothetical protein